MLERSVVAGSDERVVDGRVEAAASASPRLECELRDLEQLRPCNDPAVPIERGELRILPEPGEEGLEPLQLPLGGGKGEEALHARGHIEQQLDVGAHGTKCPPLHQDVLVTTSGGRVTTRTGAGAIAAT